MGGTAQCAWHGAACRWRVLGSKPYAASGAYINRMSDYCRGCAYDPGKRLGDGACPFNAMYWAFLDRHEDRLGRNMRMAHPYRC